MVKAASDKLGKEINELSQLLEEVTIPYRGTEKLASKQKESTKKIWSSWECNPMGMQYLYQKLIKSN